MSNTERFKKISRKLNDQAQDVLRLPGFEPRIVAIRKELSIPGGGFKSTGEAMTVEDLLESDSKVSQLHAHTNEMLTEFKLRPSWHRAIMTYILLNELRGWFAHPTVSHRLDKDGKIIGLTLEIEKDTILDDIQAMWPVVELMQESMPGRFSKKYKAPTEKNRKLVEDILRLRAEGKPDSDISIELGLNGYSDVSNMVRNYKNRRDGIR